MPNGLGAILGSFLEPTGKEIPRSVIRGGSMGVWWCIDDVLMFTMPVGRSMLTLHEFELDQIGNGVAFVGETTLPTLDYLHVL